MAAGNEEATNLPPPKKKNCVKDGNILILKLK
jgi:hypothetical protein